MPGVKLTTSTYEGHVVVALCGELDVTGAADAEAAITALVAQGQYLVIDMSALEFLDRTAERVIAFRLTLECPRGETIAQTGR